MTNDLARQHARQFLQPLSELTPQNEEAWQQSFLEAAEAVVEMANTHESGVEAVKEALQWAEKPVDEALLQAFQQIPGRGLDRDLDGGGPDGIGLALAAGYARTAQVLNQRGVRDELMSRLRSPEILVDDVRSGLRQVEEDFLGHLMIEAKNERARDERFARQIDRSASDLQELKPRLDELATRGEGRAGSWEIGVVAVCSLAAWWCVAAAVVVVVVVVAVIIGQK